jgi:hypothetical protein
MPILFTHVHVDMDAVASMWAFLRFAPEAQFPSHYIWRFVPARWNGTMGDSGVDYELQKQDRAIDIDCGGKGINGFGDKGEERSCFHILVRKYCDAETQTALTNLIKYVDLQETTGSAVGSILDDLDKDLAEEGMNIPPSDKRLLMSFNLTSVLNCLRRTFRGNDDRIFQAMEHIFDGYLESSLARLRGDRDASKAEFYADGKIALLPKDAEGTATGILMERGADFVVYREGHNIGISRKNGCNTEICPPTVEVLLESKGGDEEWYRHEAGFLLCHGSRKSPAKEPSKITGDDLAKALAASL